MNAKDGMAYHFRSMAWGAKKELARAEQDDAMAMRLEPKLAKR